ncbi:MAG: co-chaperone GroES [Pseudomonadales bacterium]|jgi:chaperonin GroES|nr:co-chaperone GroES [Pseudomonadales bacterium]
MAIRPLHDRVVVRRIEAESRSAGGIVIPDSASEKPDQGEVVAVGPGAHLEDGSVRPVVVQPGDRVLFGKYAGSEVKLNGEELLVIKESEILAVIETTEEVEKAA